MLKFCVFFFGGGLSLSSCFATEVELSGEYGVITSPGYPEPYAADQNTTWHISAPPGFQVVTYFSVFDLEDSYDDDLGGACVYDFVQVENRGQTRRLCGNHQMFPSDAPSTRQRFRSQDNSMTVKFVSDYGNDEGDRLVGFKAHYIIEDRDECAEMEYERRNAFEDWDQLIYCNHYCVNTPGSYKCTCRPGFVLHENMHTCKAVCEGEVITDDEGFVASPDYPQPYSRLTDCDWTIQVRPGLSLNLQFEQEFEIENHFNYSECLYDYLKVEYGHNEEFFCHDIPYNGQMIRTNVREVRLEFHTDNAIELGGFRVNFTTTRQRCLAARNAPTNGRKPANTRSYYEFEDVINFTCDPGYTLVGEENITCQNDGTWTDQAPICQIKVCGYPTFLGDVAYSTLEGRANLNYSFRDVVNVTCIQWYEITAGLTEWRCSEDAEWVPTAPGSDASQVPVCSPICGLKNGEDRSLVVAQIAGGEVSNPNEWPWLVFVHLAAQPNVAATGYTCGGALISPDFVLTAAHCVTGAVRDFPPNGQVFANSTHVFIGAHDRRMDRITGMTRARNVPVQEIIRHPQYDQQAQLDFDVALLRLGETVLMSDIVRPICLPTMNDYRLMVPGTTNGEVAGWGQISVLQRPSYVLRHIVLPSVTRNRCWTSFLRAADDLNFDLDPRLTLTSNMFCAGFDAGGTGATCNGDSGGPFMVEDTSGVYLNGTYYTFGIVSFGLASTVCGESVSYTVFTHLLPRIVEWINSQI